MQAGGHRFDPGWLHITVVNANRRYAECWLDVVAGVYLDAVDEGLQDGLYAGGNAAVERIA